MDFTNYSVGIYRFYGVDILTLQDRPGFPILIDGHNADNDPARSVFSYVIRKFRADKNRYFVGGTVLQRPSLAMVNGMVLGGFGGHCDLFNYTGMVVAVSTTPGVGMCLRSPNFDFTDTRKALPRYLRWNLVQELLQFRAIFL